MIPFPRPARIALLLTFLCLGLAASPQPATADSDLILILDASGSMWGQIEEENKIVIARRVLGELVDYLPEGQNVGLIAYGHRREGDCADIEMVTPVGPLDKAALKATVDGLNPKGKTPLTASVNQAFEAAEKTGNSSTVVLVSDGLETCNGDPCAAVKAAKEKGIDFVLHVVGFDVAKEDVSSLECAAQAGEGLFLTAEDASGLSSALEAAVAQPADLPAGGISVKAVTDGALQDVALRVVRKADGEEAGIGRTYASPETNPRLIPLAAGTYDVTAKAVGLRGNVERSFQVTVPEGEIVEKELDFSAGELRVGLTRNGALSDATVVIYSAGTQEQVGAGRTYANESSNPRSFELTAGTYDVEVKAIEIGGDPKHRFEGIAVEPGGAIELAHDWSSGILKVGAVRDGELVDATVNVLSVQRNASEGQGRTYTSVNSNPKTFNLLPGTYKVTVNELRGERRELMIEVRAGEVAEEMVDMGAGGSS